MQQKELELEHLDGRRFNMDYRFIAEMRDGRIITLCEWDRKELFETIINRFEESDTILRFAIEKNNDIVVEKYLSPKEKPIVRRKVK